MVVKANPVVMVNVIKEIIRHFAVSWMSKIPSKDIDTFLDSKYNNKILISLTTECFPVPVKRKNVFINFTKP